MSGTPSLVNSRGFEVILVGSKRYGSTVTSSIPLMSSIPPEASDLEENFKNG